MKTDRELLELAAKAAGIDLDWDVPPKSPPWTITGTGDARGPGAQWDPLIDDGDALRLAVKLHIRIASMGDRACAFIGLREFWEPENNDPYSATRRAIVRAAAAIGETL